MDYGDLVLFGLILQWVYTHAISIIRSSEPLQPSSSILTQLTQNLDGGSCQAKDQVTGIVGGRKCFQGPMKSIMGCYGIRRNKRKVLIVNGI